MSKKLKALWWWLTETDTYQGDSRLGIALTIILVAPLFYVFLVLFLSL